MIPVSLKEMNFDDSHVRYLAPVVRVRVSVVEHVPVYKIILKSIVLLNLNKLLDYLLGKQTESLITI